MFRHIWTIVTILACSGGVTSYSLMRVASLSDAADEAAVIAKARAAADETKIGHKKTDIT